MAEKASPESAGEAGPAAGAAAAADEIRFLDLLIVVAKRKRLVLGFPSCIAILTAIGSFFATPIYTGTTRILPPQQSGSTAASLISQLGGALGGMASLAGLGARNTNEIYVAMLKSRTVADNLIVRFDLNKRFESEKFQSDTRRVLEVRTTVVSGRDGIITIEVEDKDPKFAAELANAYVDELAKLTKVLAVTTAARQRLFFEQQLVQAKENLVRAEVAARQGLEKGGLTQVESQGRSLIEVTARLRAQISVKEVQIAAMRTFAAEGNPELRMAQEEQAALKRELGRIEGTAPTADPRKGGKIGSGGLDNVDLLRNVKYYEFLYEFLAKQYEVAKIDEARDSTIIQVMDVAVEPDRRTRPKRTLAVLISTTVAGLLAIAAAFLLEAFERARRDPGQVRRFQDLVGYLRFWRAK